MKTDPNLWGQENPMVEKAGCLILPVTWRRVVAEGICPEVLGRQEMENRCPGSGAVDFTVF
jgi:hypothetical protein